MNRLRHQSYKKKEKEMMKKRPFLKSTRYDWLINYIFEPIKNND